MSRKNIYLLLFFGSGIERMASFVPLMDCTLSNIPSQESIVKSPVVSFWLYLLQEILLHGRILALNRIQSPFSTNLMEKLGKAYAIIWGKGMLNSIVYE